MLGDVCERFVAQSPISVMGRATLERVWGCEDGHAQERSLLGAVLATVAADELWIADRHVCPRAFLSDSCSG